jgi:hypothetical protein
MKAELLSHYGDDLTICNVARVSYGKQSDEFTDRDIKLISEELTEFRKRQDKQTQINFLMYANELVFQRFNQFSCRDKIEETRIEDTAQNITKFAITQEKSVLGKSSKENTVYIIIGSLVVLSSLLILLKSKK